MHLFCRTRSQRQRWCSVMLSWSITSRLTWPITCQSYSPRCSPTVRLQSFQCQRTKATYVTTHALAPAAMKPLTECLRTQPFSILIDEATDRTDDKTVLIMARYLCKTQEKVMTSFLAMPECPIADSVKLFKHIENTMEENGIPWGNILGQSSDSASVMVGRHR